MKYDFTTLPDRHGRDSIAVDGLGKGFAPDAPQPGFDAIPMWVADMNFVCLPTIQQAVIERVQHPAFGYFDPTPEYYGSIIRWQETRNDVTGLTAEAIGYENGVLGGVISMARSMNPNSAGSQFFIMHKDAPHLDGQYAAFGKVVAGMDVVDKIASEIGRAHV